MGFGGLGSMGRGFGHMGIPLGGANLRTPLPVGTLYASSVNDNVASGPGNDTTGNGTAGNPYLTVDKLYTASSSGGTGALGGAFNAGVAYKHASVLNIAKPLTLQPVWSYGATIQATTSSGRTVTVNPGNGGSVTFGKLTIDGQSANPEGIELSNTPTAAFNFTANGTKVIGCTLYGIWTQNNASHAVVTLNNVTVSLGNARGCIQHKMAADASLTINGASGTITGALLSGVGGFLTAYGAAAGCTLGVYNATANVTMGAAFSGTTCGAVLVNNIHAPILSGVQVTVTATAAASKQGQGIALQPTNDANALDTGSFSVYNCAATVHLSGTGSGYCFIIGWDSVTDADAANGLLNGGAITSCAAIGDDTSRAQGIHGFLISSHADTVVSLCTGYKVGQGLVSKEAAAQFSNCQISDFSLNAIYFKAARTGALATGCTTTSVSGNDNANHICVGPNPTTTNNTAAATITNNHCINDGASGVTFVNIVNASQVYSFSGNTYELRRGSLYGGASPTPFLVNGSYLTFAQWKATYEPDAVAIGF